MQKIKPALLTVLLFILAAETQGAEKRKLSLDDFYQFQSISQPAFSPDGRWITYVVTTKNKEKNSRNADIWMIPALGGNPVRLTYHEKGDTHPLWSPDGKYLAFLSSREEKNQIWVFQAQGGEPYQLTTINSDVESFVWSPDSSLIAFLAKDPETAAEEKDQKNEETKEPKIIVVNRLQHKRDGEGYLSHKRRHIWVVSLQDRTMKKLTDGPYDEEDICFSPDGQEIFFSSNRTDNPDGNRNSDIWAVELETGKIRQVTTDTRPETNPSVSWSGQEVAYLQVSSPVYGTSFLWNLPAKGGKAKKLTAELDRNIQPPLLWSKNDDYIYFIVEDSGNRHLSRIKPRGGEVERIVPGEVVVEAAAISADGRYLAFTMVAPLAPPELYIYQEKGKEIKKLTSLHEKLISELKLSQPENIHYPSFDGQEIEGWLMKPVDFTAGQKYPLIVMVHGGPNAQYETSFRFEFQLLAAEGYAVLYTNPRGSSGYGEPFGRAIWADWGNKDLKDIMAGVDYALQQGYIDPSRIGIYGWSYGGIMTNYAITRTTRFRAAVSGASDSDYFSCYGTDDLHLWWEEELGLPWENFDLYRQLSPIKDITKVKTPTLFLGGQFDYRCPLPQSEQMYLSLKRLGVDTELVIYPGESHEIRRLDYQVDRLKRVLAWFNRYLK